MCVGAATLALISKGATAGLGVMQFFQSQASARAEKRAAEQQAQVDLQTSTTEQENAVREERYQRGAEVVDIASRGVSGAAGSPFLVALENSENFGINLSNFGQQSMSRFNNTIISGRNRASDIRARGIGGLVQGVQAGIGGYRDYRRARQNSVYLGGHTLPGVA